jgi:YfiH family protein
MSVLKFAKHENGVRWAFFPELQAKGLCHGISTREGGHSVEELATLNLGVKVNDSAENLQINRRKFCEAVGVDVHRVVASGQIHGDHVAVVDERQAGQRLADTDGLVTRTPNLPLLLFFADCVPLLFYDPVHRVIGLSHAGWKGTFRSIGPRTLNIMQHAFGTDPEDCLVGIGPSIGPDDYEVDEPVMTEIESRWPVTAPFARSGRPGHWMLDLWAWNRQQMLEAGVPEPNILIGGISTAQNSDLFFSHRASGGKAGRFGVLMSL